MFDVPATLKPGETVCRSLQAVKEQFSPGHDQCVKDISLGELKSLFFHLLSLCEHSPGIRIIQRGGQRALSLGSVCRARLQHQPYLRFAK